MRDRLRVPSMIFRYTRGPPNWYRRSIGLGIFSQVIVSTTSEIGSLRVTWNAYIIVSLSGTVISIHEAPNYDTPKGDDAEMLRRTEELRNMRKNTHDLLSQLSKIGIEKYKFRVASQKGVRSDLTKTTSRHPASRTRTTVMESSQAVEASANLFYYLFEDYTAPTLFLSNSSVTLGKLVRNDHKP